MCRGFDWCALFLNTASNYGTLLLRLGSHTAAHLKETITEMVDKWDIANKTHVIVRDNAANITKACDELRVQHIGCFAHTLQLCVNKTLDANDRDVQWVSKSLSKCRQVVGHFSHSVLAKEKLRAIQGGIKDCKKQRLVQVGFYSLKIVPTIQRSATLMMQF